MKLRYLGLITVCCFSAIVHSVTDKISTVAAPIHSDATVSENSFSGPPKRIKSDDDVVQVGSFEQNQQVTTVTQFSDFTEVETFVNQHLSTSPSLVLKLVSQYLADTPELPNEQKVDLLIYLSLAHNAMGQSNLALNTLTKTYQIVPDIAAAQQQKIETQIAQFYQQDNDYYHAIKTLNVAFNLARSENNVRDSVILAQAIARHYIELEDIEPAATWLETAQNMAIKQGNDVTKLVYYLEKSKLHMVLDERFMAEQAAKQAILLSQKLNLNQSYNDANLLLSAVYLAGKKFLHAEPILQKLFDNATKSRDKGTQFEVLLAIIEHQIAQNKMDLAEQYIKHANTLIRFVASKPNALLLRQQLAWQQTRLSMARSKWSQAKRYIEQLPFDNNAEWFASYLIILASSGTSPFFQQSLQQYIELNLTQQAIRNKRIHSYQAKILREKLVNSNHQLSELQQQTSSYIAQTTQLLTSKSTTISVLMLLLFSVIFAVLARRYPLKDKIPRDRLTGLPDISFLHSEIPPLIQTNQPFSFLLVDLDNFDSVNVSVGYKQGDEILLSVVRQIQDLLPNSCLLGRYSGDSFFVIARGFNTAQAKILADRIRLQLHKCGASIQSNMSNVTGTVAVINRLDFSDIHQMLTASSKTLEQTQNSTQDKTVVFISNC